MTVTRYFATGIRRFVVTALLVALVLPVVSIATVHAATFQVTNTNDTGSGSLRNAIIQANGSPGSTITFNVGGGGAQTINSRDDHRVVLRTECDGHV